MKKHGFGFLEYTLFVILIFLVLFTLFSLLWPAMQNFYNTTLQGMIQ